MAIEANMGKISQLACKGISFEVAASSILWLNAGVS